MFIKMDMQLGWTLSHIPPPISHHQCENISYFAENNVEISLLVLDSIDQNYYTRAR